MQPVAATMTRIKSSANNNGRTARLKPSSFARPLTEPALHLSSLSTTLPISVREIRNLSDRSGGRPIVAANAPGRIRTCDPRIRSPLLYPAELQAHTPPGLRGPQPGLHPNPKDAPGRDKERATGLEPATTSLEGWSSTN